MSSIVDLQRLVDTTAQGDKDERWMATNDLCNILSSDRQIEENMEQKICNAVLKQLDDPSNEVQTVAVKCLSILLRRVNQNQIVDISKKLAILILDGNAALRDIYSICMKTLIADVPDSMGKAVSDHLSNALIAGIDRPQEDVKKECLDNVSELLKRFGHEMNDNHFNRIMTSTIQQLKHSKATIRKRASNTLGALAFVLSEESLSQLMGVLLTRIGELEKASKTSKASPESATLIATIGVISRTVGYKLGKFLSAMVPLFIRFCGEPDDEDLQTDQGHELRESCFPGLESFVLRCPKEIVPHLSDILNVCLKFVEYDPNYQYDEDNGDNMDVEGEDFGEDDYYGEGMGSDDDDSSWKVRKAAVKVISAMISTHPLMVRELYELSADRLLNRFKEREENVRLDIIACVTKLIEMNLPVSHLGSESVTAELSRAAPLLRQKSTSHLLSDKVSLILRVSCQQLAGTSIPSKIAVTRVLKALVQALQGGLDDHLVAQSKLSGHIEKMMQEKNQTLKLETLHFLRVCYAHHSSAIVLESSQRFLPCITRAVNDEWYKIIAESLRVLETMIIHARPLSSLHSDFDTLIVPIYDCIMSRLVALDIDLEIKECGIHCAGTLFRHCGDRLSENQLNNVLQLFAKRLENETTRTATLRAISAIATSPLTLNLSPLISSSGDLLASFLKQYSRNLKQLSLQTITAIVNHPQTSNNATFATAIITESAHLVHENDLHLSNLTLVLWLSLLQKDIATSNTATNGGGAALTCFCETALPKMFRFAKASVSHSAAIDSLVALFRFLVTHYSTNTSHAALQFSELFANLYDLTRFSPAQDTSSISTATSKNTAVATTNTLVTIGFTRASLTNVSKCVAAITTTLPTVALLEGVQRFARDAATNNNTSNTNNTSAATHTNSHSHDLLVQLALLCLGEVGQQADLSMLPDLKDVILSCFASGNSEDVKLCAASAFGHIAVGSMQQFLPMLLQCIVTPSDTRQQYLLLTALRETLQSFGSLHKDFSPFLDTVLPILAQEKDSEEESVRNMVAECLGVLVTLAPERVLRLLQTDFVQPNLSNNSSNSSATTAMSEEAEQELARRKHVLKVALNALRTATARTLNISATAHAAVHEHEHEHVHASSQSSSTAVSSKNVFVVQQLAQNMSVYLPLLQEEDLEVKKAALLLVNSAAHHQVSIITSHITETIFPVILSTLQIKLERVIDLGPFKHKVDDNLVLRKLCIASLETLLLAAPDKFDSNAVLELTPKLLADNEEVKMLFIQLLPRLAKHNSGAVAIKIELIYPVLEKMLAQSATTAGTTNAAGNTAAAATSAGAAQADAAAAAAGGKAAVVIDHRTLLKVILQLDKNEDIRAMSRRWCEFVGKLRMLPTFVDMIRQLESESTDAF